MKTRSNYKHGNKYVPFKGDSYIPFPKNIQNNLSTINDKNEDNK